MKRGDILVGHDRAAGAGQARCDPFSGRSNQSLADDDGMERGQPAIDGLARADAATPPSITSPSAAPGRLRPVAELHGDRVDHGSHHHLMGHVAAFYRDIRFLGIDGIAFAHELLHHLRRIARGEQGPAVAPPDPLEQHLEVRFEPDRNAVRFDVGPRARVHIGAAAGREHLRPLSKSRAMTLRSPWRK